jgi:hypothetical protein
MCFAKLLSASVQQNSKMDRLLPAIIRHLLRSPRGGSLAVIIVCISLLSIAAKGGLMGVPLAFLILSLLLKSA